MQRNHLAVLMGGSAIVAVMAPALAFAQSATVEEVTVTAQRRETKLETTAMTVNVVSGEQLAQQGVTEIKDLKSSVPGMALNESPGGLTGVGLRGVGTSGGSQLFEQSVGLFIDNVYHPRSRQFRDGLFDMERIEVVKGSQGVLFGKNTSIGAISIISRGPGSTYGGFLQGEYETEYGGYSVQGAVDVPFSDKIRMRLSAINDDPQGWVRNVTMNRDEPDERRGMIRAVTEFDISPQLTATLKLQTSLYKNVGNNFEFAAGSPQGPIIAAGVLDGGALDYVKYESGGSTGDTTERQTSDDHALTINYEMSSGHVLTATTGYSRLKFTYNFDSDSTPAAFLLSNFNEKYEQLSQEVRLASPVGERFDYILGAFALTSKTRYNYISYYKGFPVAGGLWGVLPQLFDQDQDTIAVFGQGNYRITPQLEFTLGARYSHDKKEGTYSKFLASNYGVPSALAAAPTNTSSRTVTDKTVDVSATLSYRLTDRSTAYVSVGRGNKGAGFLNQAGAFAREPSPFFAPKEVATTIEAGVKGRFMDGRAYASLAVYHLDIKDFQDSFYNSTVRAFQVRSLDAKSQGVELEGQFQVTGWLNLYGNAAYNPKAELENGERMQRAPKFTGTVGARVNQSLSDNWDLGGNIELQHASNMLHQPASAPGNNGSGRYDLVNLRAQVTYKPADLDLYVNISNLTKETYTTFAFGAPLGIGSIVALNQPRMITLGARKTW